MAQVWGQSGVSLGSVWRKGYSLLLSRFQDRLATFSNSNPAAKWLAKYQQPYPKCNETSKKLKCFVTKVLSDRHGIDPIAYTVSSEG
jgi:hypothetical protein